MTPEKQKKITPKSGVNWRKDAAATDADPDDEDTGQTPPDVVAQLGFDPRDEENTR